MRIEELDLVRTLGMMGFVLSALFVFAIIVK